VVNNLSAQEQAFRLDLGAAGGAGFSLANDLLTGQTQPLANGMIAGFLPPYAYRWISLR